MYIRRLAAKKESRERKILCSFLYIGYLTCSSAKVTVVASQTSVEPISALVGAIAVVYIEVLLPFALFFAAGAMVLVAVHELVPDCQSGKDNSPYSATMGIILGFAIMMLLDAMLG
jgi:zinc transporter ZupT